MKHLGSGWIRNKKQGRLGPEVLEKGLGLKALRPGKIRYIKFIKS